MKFTGERLIPDDPAHRDLYWEHVARYALAAGAAKDKRVLDLGCGTGYGAHLLAEQGAASVVGIDNSAEAIAYAAEHYPHKNISFQVGEATQTGLPADEFDLVVCFELIEHLEKQTELVTEIARLLAPGGVAFISTPDADRPYAKDNPFHVRELKRDEFTALLNEHFPQVRLLGQRRLSAVAFGEGDNTLPLINKQKHDAYYWIAVCGDDATVEGLIYEIPQWQNLADLRAQLEKRDTDVTERDERIVALQTEVREKTDWAKRQDERAEQLEQDRQDRDVRIELLRRELDETKQTLGYRLHQRLAPWARKIRNAVRSLGKGAIFFLYFLISLPLLLLRAFAALPRVGDAIRAWRIGRRLHVLMHATQPTANPLTINKREGDPPGVSVVVPSYQGRDLLVRYLPSVLREAERCPFPVEIIVVEDGGDDDTADWLAANHPQVVVVRHENNRGFAAAANTGFARATYPIVYLCNNDMELHEGAIANAARTLWRESAFAATSAITMEDENRAGMETGLATGALHGSRLLLQHHGDLGEQPRSTLYAGGGSTAYDRAKVLALGGFDGLYAPFYGEDLDLSYRAWKTGETILVDPTSKVTHRHRGTIGRVAQPEQIAQTFARNLLLFQWANLTDQSLIDRHCRSLWRDVLTGKLSGAAVRDAWDKQAEIGRARGRQSTVARSDAEILDGAGSRVWDLGGQAKRLQKDRLKVLAVAPYCPYPPTHGGAVRMWELLTRMANKHEVHLAAMVEREAELDARDELSKHFPRVHLHLRGRPDPAPHWWPASVAEFNSTSFTRAVDRMCGEEDYDIVQAEYPILAHTLPRAGRAKLAITEIDVFHLAYRRTMQATSGWIEKLKSTYEWLRMFRYEVEHADRADMLLAMSEHDAEQCRRVTQTVVHVVPNGVDPSRIAFQPRVEHPHEVMFVGHFRHTPNVEGVCWFAQHVWPRVRDAEWRARLLVVGAAPPPEVEALAHDPTISVTGFVDDLSPLYARVACFIAPIRRGSGTRLKIIEAMAAGVPVLSTSVGVEGLDVVDGQHALIADQPESAAAACLRLLREAELRDALAKNARALVEKKYNWDAIAERLDAAWHEVVE